MNLEEIEQRHARTKLIRAAFGGGMSQGIDDVDWLIAEVKRLREEAAIICAWNDRLQCGLDSCMEMINLQLDNIRAIQHCANVYGGWGDIRRREKC